MRTLSKIAVAYIRYPSNKQCLEKQITSIKEFAEHEDYEIVGMYIGRISHNVNNDLSSLNGLVEDSKNNEFQYVLFYADEASNQDESAFDNEIEELKQNGFKPISIIDYTHFKVIVLKGDFKRDAMYSLKAPVQQPSISKKEYPFTHGKVLYGYKVKHGQYCVNHKEAKVVHEIFKQTISGQPIMDIIQSLNSRGITCRNGTEWNYQKIYRILCDERYTGIIRRNGKSVDYAYPPIISEGVYKKSRELAMNRYRGVVKQHHTTYLLGGKLFCDRCGSDMVGVHERYSYLYNYVCKRRVAHLCTQPSLNRNFLEKEVSQIIIEHILDNSNELSQSICERYIDDDPVRNDIEYMESKLTTIKMSKNGTINRTKRLHLQPDFVKLNQLENDKKIVIGKIEELKSKILAPLQFEEVEKFLESLYDTCGNVSEPVAKAVNTIVESIHTDGENLIVNIYSRNSDNKGKEPLQTRTYKRNFSYC